MGNLTPRKSSSLLLSPWGRGDRDSEATISTPSAPAVASKILAWETPPEFGPASSWETLSSDSFRDQVEGEEGEDEERRLHDDGEGGGEEEEEEEERACVGELERFLLGERPEDFWPQLLSRNGSNDAGNDALLSFLDHHKATIPFVRALLRAHAADAEKAGEAGSLFRSHTSLCALVARLEKRMALGYLHSVVRGPLSLVVCCPEPLLLRISGLLRRPQGHPAAPAVTPEDMVREPTFLLLQQLLLALTRAVASSSPPQPLRQLLWEVRAAAEERFPGKGRAAAALFLFHRFLCPAVCDPTRFEMPQTPLPASLTLLFLSRALRMLSSDARFDPLCDGPFSLAFNPTLATLAPDLLRFLDTSSTFPSSSSSPASTLVGYPRIPEHLYIHSLGFLENSLRAHPAIVSPLPDAPRHHSPTLCRLRDILQPTVPPLEALCWIRALLAGVDLSPLHPSLARRAHRWFLVHCRRPEISSLIDRLWQSSITV